MESSKGYFGEPVARREDLRLLKGQGKFAADLRFPGMLEIAFVRSPLAHGQIVDLNVDEAREADGVIAIFTAVDFEDHIAPFTRPFYKTIHPKVREQGQLKIAPYYAELMARERVVRVGEPIAAVVAKNRYLAEDAVELVEVDIEPLPAVSDVMSAIDGPPIHPEMEDNVHARFLVSCGDPERALKSSPHRLSETIRFRRSVGSPIETRGVVVEPDPSRDLLTVWANNQRPHLLRSYLAEMLHMVEENVRVVAPDIGGSFGGGIYAEEILVAGMARMLGAPLRWIEDRRENLGNARHSRDQVHRVEVGFDSDGRILGLKDWFAVDCGAHNPFAITISYNTATHLRGQFQIDNFACEGLCVATNKLQNTPVRGAGRPAAVWVMDRIVDLVADEVGRDPAEVRRLNLIPAESMPYDMGVLYRDGAPVVYDSGDFPDQFDRLLKMVDLDGFRRTQRDQKSTGRHIGIGFSSHVEGSGYGPYEGARIRVDRTGHVIVNTGTTSHGQSHETTLAQVCAEALGVPIDSITVRAGDTSLISHGGGTFASRVAVTGGSAVHLAAKRVKSKLLAVAGHLLEASPEDLEIVDGVVRPKGVPDIELNLAEIAEAASPGGNLPEDIEPGVEEQSFFVPPAVTFSSGSHAAIVEVDAETGVVDVLGYFVVDECGRVINPVVVDGQQHGGVAHGVGNALLEEIVFDSEGQLLTGSFIDYLLPTASDVPRIEVEHQVSPSTLNPLGVKGVGEGATSSAPAAIASAIVDALRPLRLRLNELPASPARLRSLIEEAERTLDA